MKGDALYRVSLVQKPWFTMASFGGIIPSLSAHRDQNMFFVFLKKGEVVDVLSVTDSKTAGIADRLLSGEADEIKQVESLDELKKTLGQKPSVGVEEVDKWLQNVAVKFEGLVNRVLDKLEQKVKSDPDTLFEVAKKAGEAVLKEVRKKNNK
jgi:hypothetical protein